MASNIKKLETETAGNNESGGSLREWDDPNRNELI